MTTTLQLNDERRAFVESIRDFCRRECGTREQRDRLTRGGEHPHNQALYEQMADLGWLGVAVPEEYGGSGGGAVDMCLLLDELAHGLAPVGGIGTTFIVAGACVFREQFGTHRLPIHFVSLALVAIYTAIWMRRLPFAARWKRLSGWTWARVLREKPRDCASGENPSRK